VDFIGPWKITVTAQVIEFHAPTWVNTVTNLPEISRINNKTSECIAMKFANNWFTPSANKNYHISMMHHRIMIIWS
jgi:hypothetical protein